MSDDWAMKGCHVHVGRVEVSIHPTIWAESRFGGVFASTSADDLQAAEAAVRGCLADPEFRSRLRGAVERAMEHMPSIAGFWAERANGRLKEFKFLLIALDRL